MVFIDVLQSKHFIITVASIYTKKFGCLLSYKYYSVLVIPTDFLVVLTKNI